MAFISLRERVRNACCQKLNLGQINGWCCVQKAMPDQICCMVQLRESLTALGKYHRILNTKGVWESKKVSRDISA